MSVKRAISLDKSKENEELIMGNEVRAHRELVQVYSTFSAMSNVSFLTPLMR